MEKKKTKRVIVLSLILVVIIIVGIVVILFNSNVIGGKSGQIEKFSSKLKDSDTDFSFKFLKMENKKDNIIYSPLSIKYALKMLNEGANGETKKQIENVIEKTHVVKNNNIDEKISLANALYVRDSYAKYAKKEYKNILHNKYNAEIKYDSLKNATNINNWIEKKTFGQIKNMLEDEAMSRSDNKMILINALAIDMEWKNKFDCADTDRKIFYLEDGNTIEATTMNMETQSDDISYYKDKNVTALAMELEQYGDEQMEFVAIMPNDNLLDYIYNISVKDIKKITNNLIKASKTKNGLDIYVPKFSHCYELSLENDLKTLGINDAFDSKLADFSKMSSSIEPIYIGGALHKANIDFTEKGIKAAAVTVINMCEITSIDDTKPIEIKIDKPFMYFIRDKKTNEIWFVGTVYEPNLYENDKTDYLPNILK